MWVFDLTKVTLYKEGLEDIYEASRMLVHLDATIALYNDIKGS